MDADVLIVSDDPEHESFRQILILKRNIEDISSKRVDLITLSDKGICLNGKLMTRDLSEIFAILKNILKRPYSTLIISLRLKHLKRLFSRGNNILDSICKVQPNITIFIFGANSILKTIKKRENVFLRSRRGVAKLTQELKEAVIQHIKGQP